MSQENTTNGKYLIGWDDFLDDFKKTAQEVSEIKRDTSELNCLEQISVSLAGINKVLSWCFKLAASVIGLIIVLTVLKNSGLDIKVPGYIEITQEKK